ncbi:MAG: ABC transporter permease [Planctomycetota bacterium]|nr:ABC transporter permease [Planctomycetota bacterium]
MPLFQLLAEVGASLRREARRILPMAAGIAWGVASVFVLTAVSRGFEVSQRQSLESMGKGFVLLRVNRATQTRSDVRVANFVELEGEDMVALSAHSPSVEALSPKAHNWFIRAVRGGNTRRVIAVGVYPEFADIVHVPLEPGSRWLDDYDQSMEIPVAVIGHRTREALFGDEPWQGEEIQLIFSRGDPDDTVVRRFTVIGAVRDEELAGDSFYTSHSRAVYMPFSTWERMSPEGFQFFVARPRHPDDRDVALAEIRNVLGTRHGFDPRQESTLAPYYDAIERERNINAIFGGLQTFLSAVGSLILLLGAVGVANVVLMSVAARSPEFALRRALGCRRRWIFSQVFLEAGLVCFFAGLGGFVVGLWGVDFMGTIALPEGFAAPIADPGAALLPGLLLLVVSLGAAVWPAWRASSREVIEGLRGSGV